MIGQIITINGQKHEALETFKASGATWVRFSRPDGSNGYMTVEEWNTHYEKW